MTLAVDLIALPAPSRRRRATIVALLSLLLLGMQAEGLRHALSHWSGGMPKQAVLSAGSDAPCAQCALLAAGSAAVATDPPIVAAVATVDRTGATLPASPALAAPGFYLSRAPPLLS
jgi:hypothetical protein